MTLYKKKLADLRDLKYDQLWQTPIFALKISETLIMHSKESQIGIFQQNMSFDTAIYSFYPISVIYDNYFCLYNPTNCSHILP